MGVPPEQMPPAGQAPAGQMPTDQAPPDQGSLDTAETAGKPQANDPDTAVFETLVAGLREHIFGKGEEGVVKQLTESKDVARTLGEIVYVMLSEGVKQAQQAQHEVSMDVIMGAATELIDDLADLMSAHGVEIDQKKRGDALLYAQQFYVDSANPSDDERNAAKQTLADGHKDGSVNQAVSYIQQRGTEEGVDPFGVAQMDDRPEMMKGSK